MFKLCWDNFLVLPIISIGLLYLSQASHAGQAALIQPIPDNHYVVLIDDSGDMRSFKDLIINHLPAIIFEGIDDSGTNPFPAFRPQRDYLSVLFFGVDKEKNSVLPSNTIGVETVGDSVTGIDGFKEMLRDWMNKPQRFSGYLSPIASSPYLAFPVLDERLETGHLFSQTFLIFVTNEIVNPIRDRTTPALELRNFNRGYSVKDVDAAEAAIQRFSTDFQYSAPASWRRVYPLKTGSLNLYVSVFTLDPIVRDPMTVMQYRRQFELSQKAVDRSTMQAVHEKENGCIRLFHDPTLKPLSLTFCLDRGDRSESVTLDLSKETGESNSLIVRETDSIAVYPFLHQTLSPLYTFPVNEEPPRFRASFQAAFQGQPNSDYGRFYISSQTHEIQLSFQPAITIPISSPIRQYIPDFILESFFPLLVRSSIQLDGPQIAGFWTPGDTQGLSAEEALVRLQVQIATQEWICVAVLITGAIVSTVLLLFLAYQYSFRRFKPDLYWRPVPDLVLDFDRQSTNCLLVGTLTIRNNSPKKRIIRALLWNKEEPTRQGELRLAYPNLHDTGFDVEPGVTIGFIHDGDDTTGNTQLNRDVNKLLTHHDTFSVFLACDLIRDYLGMKTASNKSTIQFTGESDFGDLDDEASEIEEDNDENEIDGEDEREYLDDTDIIHDEDFIDEDEIVKDFEMSVELRIKPQYRSERAYRSVLYPIPLRIELTPERERKPYVSFVPSETPPAYPSNIYENNRLLLGRFVFKSATDRHFACPYRSEYSLTGRRGQKSLGPGSLLLEPSHVNLGPGETKETPVYLVCDGDDVPNPEGQSDVYEFRLIGPCHPDSEPGPHAVRVMRDPTKTQIELCLFANNAERQLYWKPDVERLGETVFENGRAIDETEYETPQIILPERTVRFAPTDKEFINLCRFRVGNSAKNPGRGSVSAVFNARFDIDESKRNFLHLKKGTPDTELLVRSYRKDETDASVRIDDGADTEERNVRFSPVRIEDIDGAMIPSDACRAVVDVDVRVLRAGDDGDEEVAWTARVIVPLHLEKLPGNECLSIDFGTSAIAVAYGNALDASRSHVLNLQRQSIHHDDPVVNLENSDTENSEHGTPFLPSYVAIDPDLRHEEPSDERRGYRKGYPHYMPASLVPGDPSFVGLPALNWYLEQKSERVIYSLKSWLGTSSLTIPILDEIEFQNADGSVERSYSLPLAETVQSGFAALANAYLQAGIHSPDQVVITYPNTFTAIHRNKLHRIAAAALTEPLELEAKNRIFLIRESDAVAFHYWLQTFRKHEAAGTERILVYDFGAGTLDLSLIRVTYGSGGVLNEWLVESTLGVPIAGNYINELLVRLCDDLLRDIEARTPGLNYRYKVVTEDSIPANDQKDYYKTIRQLAYNIKQVKHSWRTGQPSHTQHYKQTQSGHLIKQETDQPFRVTVGRIGERTLPVIFNPEIGRLPKLDTLNPNDVAIGIDGADIVLSIPADAIEKDGRMSAFLRFVTETVIDELLDSAEIDPDDVDTLLITGRGALWHDLRDRVKLLFPEANKPDLYERNEILMKDAVVKGALAWRLLDIRPEVVRENKSKKTKLGVVLESTGRLVLEPDDPGEPWEVDVSMTGSFRFVQINTCRPQYDRDMKGLRRFFYIDLPIGPFLRDTHWKKDGRVRIEKDESGGKLEILLYNSDGESIVGYANVNASYSDMMAPWPVGHIILKPDDIEEYRNENV